MGGGGLTKQNFVTSWEAFVKEDPIFKFNIKALLFN